MADDGFPPGLHPATWMGDLVQKKDPSLAQAKLTDFIYPGSHDAATYGEGMEDFSYQCQDKNLYEQMVLGQRYFDLRLAPDQKVKKKFIPVHGIAKHTADDFSEGPDSAKEKNLATQIMKFAKEHPSEILIIKCTVDLKDPEDKRVWAETAMNLLGSRLLPPNPQETPTYAEAVESNRNIILAFGGGCLPSGGADHAIAQHYWDLGSRRLWLGNGAEELWNEPVWQSGDLNKVLHSTESWMSKNQEKLSQRDHFWVAQLQLTPALGQSISTFIKGGASVRPKDLANGGGLGGLMGHSEDGSNKDLLKSGVLKKKLWRQHASILQYDFANKRNTGAIVAMNLRRGGGGGDGGGAEEEDEEDDDDGENAPGGGGRGGRGGRRGRGRGGRGRGHE